jgi:CMP-N-acetylneuraminic acid synthetase
VAQKNSDKKYRKSFFGKPMIAWTEIEAAIQSKGV